MEYATLIFVQALSFEHMASTPSNILVSCEKLKQTKVRHSLVVPAMGAACRAMRHKYGLSAEDIDRNHGLTRAVQYCLDRLYLHRISLNMLTNQHLMVYGHVKTVSRPSNPKMPLPLHPELFEKMESITQLSFLSLLLHNILYACLLVCLFDCLLEKAQIHEIT